MPVVVSIDTRDVTAMLSALAVGLSPAGLGAFLRDDAVGWLQGRAAGRFASEGDAASGRWEQLAAATADIRAFEGHPREHPINVRTGTLHAFVTRSRGTIRPTADGAELAWPHAAGGRTGDKLKVAQQGSKRGQNPVFPTASTVARPVLSHDQTDVAALLAVLAGHLHRVMTGGRVL